MSPLRSPFALAFLLCTLPATALAQDLLFEHPQYLPGDSGLQLAALGDANGDGIADFAVSASYEGGGTVRVFSGATQLPIYTFVGDAQTVRLGSSLALIGDVDLDGVKDLAAGSDAAVRVFSLATGQPLYTVTGPSIDRFGYSVARTADFDGDGTADFAVGAPQASVWGGGDHWTFSFAGHGYVQVFSGQSGNLLTTIYGPGNRRGFGGSIANVGNLDGDGVDDLAIGHFLRPYLPESFPPVHTYSGASLTQIGEATLPGHGAQVRALGDVDSDGTDDFVAGDLDFGVRVISGATLSILYAAGGIGPYDWFGYSLSRIGDMDGDGFPELLIGSPSPGYARILSGRTGAVLQTLVGKDGSPGLGRNVSALGDIDGDGKEEFLVTTASNYSGFCSTRVYSGRFGFSAPTNYCWGGVNEVLTSAAIGFTGSTSISGNALTMTLSSAAPGQLGLLFCGRTASLKTLNPVTNWRGVLCVGSIARRFGPAMPISSQGTLARAVDLGPGSPFTIGSTWYFQFAYSGTPQRLNSSDALAVTFTP
ncbi:MAG TPA: FG-GAP-like repeat-containing protein [Planctomycetota bacterium]|nr:FG-GAP-like repeat-containing protein [Planctomycetota bacterium]